MKFFLITCMFLVSVMAYEHCFSQQVIRARGELSFSAGLLSPLGATHSAGTATLLANMNSGEFADVRYVARITRHLHLGAWVASSKFHDWVAGEDKLYDGTSVNFLSFGPAITISTAHAGNPVKNKLRFVCQLSPGVSRIAVKTLPESGINNGSEEHPLTVESVRLSFGSQVGIHYVLTQSFGLKLLGGYHYTVADSKVFTDGNFSYLSVQAGACFRLFKDKKYKYSAL